MQLFPAHGSAQHRCMVDRECVSLCGLNSGLHAEIQTDVHY